MTVSCGPPQFKLLKNTMREVDGNGLMKGECEARERKPMGVCVCVWAGNLRLIGQGRGGGVARVWGGSRAVGIFFGTVESS